MFRLLGSFLVAGSALSLAGCACCGPMGMGSGSMGMSSAGAKPVEQSMSMSSEILGSYVKVSSALAADDLKGAKAAANEVAGHANMADQRHLAAKAAAVANAGKIEDARKEFMALTAAVEPLAAGQKEYVVMHCPMANADWVQAKGRTRNPYMGKAMLTCGRVKAST